MWMAAILGHGAVSWEALPSQGQDAFPVVHRGLATWAGGICAETLGVREDTRRGADVQQVHTPGRAVRHLSHGLAGDHAGSFVAACQVARVRYTV